MKTLLNESDQHIIFTEIRKELPQRESIEVSDEQAACREVKHYVDLRMISISAPAPVPAPKVEVKADVRAEVKAETKMETKTPSEDPKTTKKR